MATSTLCVKFSLLVTFIPVNVQLNLAISKFTGQLRDFELSELRLKWHIAVLCNFIRHRKSIISLSLTFFQRYKYFCFSYNKDILINVRTFRYKCFQSRDVIYPVLKGYSISRLITYNIASLSVSIKPVPAVNQLSQLFPIGPRAGVIYSWLLKYTLQHTTAVTKNNWGPAPPKASPV